MNGVAANSTAAASTQGGYNDWRLPNLIELQSLLASACTNPKMNAVTFPNIPLSSFAWTGQTYATNPAVVWFMFFANGGTGSVNKVSGNGVVLLVRGAQHLSPLLTTAQTLVFGAAPTLTLGSSPTVNAVSNGGAANSGNAIGYSSTTPAVCSVNASSGQITLTGAAAIGNACIVAANQLGSIANNQTYAAAAQVTLGVPVSKASQTVAFDVAPLVTVSGTGVVAATSNQGVTPVTFTSITPGTCSVSGTNGSTVTGVAVGTCTITASAPTNATYIAATANQSFSVAPALIVCNLRMNGNNPLLATREGLILVRAMLGFTGTAVTQGTGVATPWETLRDGLNATCGTSFQ